MSALFLFQIGLTPPAHAYTSLPPTRSNPYSGWTAIVKGDNNTIGMAGATVALPNSIAAMDTNPAGFAMNLGGLAAQINSFSLKDPELNHSDQSFTEYQWGLGTSSPPWGFGLTYYAPASEHVGTSEVSVRQVRASLARLIGDNAAIGVSIEYNKGIRKFDSDDFSSGAINFRVGVLYKLGEHWLLGGSFTPSNNIDPGDTQQNSFGYNQTIEVPSIAAIGIGYMPNRFFKAGFSVLGVSATPNASLLYDETIGYGRKYTLQPRFGVSYIMAEWSFLKVELAMGTYYEVARIEGQNNRAHGTFGLDVNPWFLNMGVGTDMARDYKNWMLGLGIDLVRTMRTFDLIPKDTVPPYNSTFPPPLRISANGLADGFTQGEHKTISPVSADEVRKIVSDIPKKMEKKFGRPEDSKGDPNVKTGRDNPTGDHPADGIDAKDLHWNNQSGPNSISNPNP